MAAVRFVKAANGASFIAALAPHALRAHAHLMPVGFVGMMVFIDGTLAHLGVPALADAAPDREAAEESHYVGLTLEATSRWAVGSAAIYLAIADGLVAWAAFAIFTARLVPVLLSTSALTPPALPRPPAGNAAR